MFNQQILQGNALTKLKELESESVDCIITSPPYWALRDYKVDGQIGNEKTIDEYISNLIKIFDEAKRVLKKTGSAWVVLGDTYNANKPNNTNGKTGTITRKAGLDDMSLNHKVQRNIGEKSLCMIPERFAIAMIDSGWILRNKIIWHKRNCMPSSAKDRFTIDYEYIYFFSKSQKYYFKTQYEPHLTKDINPPGKRHEWNKNLQDKGQSVHSFHKPDSEFVYNPQGRIKRCVWTINTKPFSEAHFAVFPEELVKQCLDAGCPPEGIVLDMFMGSGTTALVALKHNRKFIGIELNEDYIEIAKKRIEPYLYQTKLSTGI